MPCAFLRFFRFCRIITPHLSCTFNFTKASNHPVPPCCLSLPLMNLALLHSLQDYHPTPELYFNPLRPIQATFAETTVIPPPPAIPEVEDLPAAAPVHTTQEGEDQSGSFFSNVFGWSSKKGSDGKHLHSLHFYLAECTCRQPTT
jgi:hypothetical protein